MGNNAGMPHFLILQTPFSDLENLCSSVYSLPISLTQTLPISCENGTGPCLPIFPGPHIPGKVEAWVPLFPVKWRPGSLYSQ